MDASLRSLEHLFQALGDTTRLRILGLLLAGEVCVCEIHGALKISQPKASRHLAYLRRAGLVVARRDGLWMHYRLADAQEPAADDIRRAVLHALSHVATVRRDADRLERSTGCCAPATTGAPILTCCPPEKLRSARA
jgi:ArsR family transcriptional regulator